MERGRGRLPPGPRSWMPGGVFRRLRAGPLEYLTKIAGEYGDVLSFKALGQRYVVVNHPELAREILMGSAETLWKGPALQNSKGILGEGLLTAEGEVHRGQRRLIGPAFHAKHVEKYAGTMVGKTAEMMKRWRGGMGEKGRRHFEDIRTELMALTLMIAGEALFGTMLDKEAAMVRRCLDDLMNNYVRTVVPWGWVLNLLPLPSTKKLAKARGDLIGLVDRMVVERRGEMEGAGIAQRSVNMPVGTTEAQPGGGCPYADRHVTREAGQDLLSVMIEATDGEGGGGGKGRLTDAQLRDQCITILTAGHETTANALTFTLYLLAQHPEEQEKLRAEVKDVLNGGEMTAESVGRLERTRWALAESMRLLPPVWTLGRQNQQAMELGGFHLPAKCTILIPQWILHRDARFWDEPLAFLPERWREPKHPRFAYLPFSTGARNCIGESFAWLEMVMVLGMLVREFQFRVPAGLEMEGLRLMPAITLRPAEAVGMEVLPVNSAVR
jgi:cytochrome P450